MKADDGKCIQGLGAVGAIDVLLCTTLDQFRGGVEGWKDGCLPVPTMRVRKVME